MSVSFFDHKKELIEAYKDVLDDKSDTDWALFTYEGKSNELKVAGVGEDGLDELESEFNSSKIMYAFIRVKDPKTSLNKFIFLHWQGEGAPANRKGACANHVRDVERFFKGFHITINARSEDDVTPEQIMLHVSKASASTYSFDKSHQQDDEEPAAVGSVYKRINPSAEISSTRKETYWEKQEKEEEERKKAEERQRTEMRKKHEQELREREKESSRRRSEWEKERERDIAEKFRAAKLVDDHAEIRKLEKERWEAEEREFAAHSERGRKRSESIEKAAEAAVLVQKRGQNPHAMWEQRVQESSTRNLPPEPRKPIRSHEPAIESYDPVEEETNQLQNVAEVSEESHDQYEAPPVAYEDDYEQPDQTAHAEQEQEYNAYEELPQQEEYTETSNAADTQNYAAVSGESGYQARALYDYQAADGTEISFDPDQIITNINMVDEGWWEGTAPDGSYGLFPANYVELLQ